MMCLRSALFVRILSRNGDVYLLKVITLAVAFAASILVTLFSTHEFEYDTNHENADHVFRMLARNTDKDYTGNRLSASIPKAVLKSIREQFSDSIIISRVKALNKVTIIDQLNQPFYDQNIYAADSTIDSIFSFDIVGGSIDNFTSLHNVAAIASKRAASRYFGNEPVVGKTVRLTAFGDTLDVVVVAVFDDFPSNTHEDF